MASGGDMWGQGELAHLRLVGELASSVGFVVLDSSGSVVEANRAAALLLNRRPAELIGEHWRGLLHPAGGISLTATDLAEGQLAICVVGGTERHLRLVEHDLGRGVRLVELIDVSELVALHHRSEELAARLAADALVDPLTGVANRAAITARARQSLDRLGWGLTRGVAVALVDLDHFKSLNDAHGHHRGDQALCRAAELLRRSVRSHDLVGRLGGDEFLVVFDDVADRERAHQLSGRLVEAFARDAAAAGAPTASVGVTWTSEPRELIDLITEADDAMYQAKRRGRGRSALYDEATSIFGPASRQRRDIDRAVTANQFRLHYQPVVDSGGNIVALEALLRWQHPEHGLVGPAAFLPFLLDSGRIRTVGRWVLSQACRDLARFRRLARPRLHVNLSPTELCDPELPGQLAASISAADIEAEFICVEITEQALEDVAALDAASAQLTELGVAIGLDDFGTGSSSLVHLRRRPLDLIKIDRSFVADLDSDPDSRSILHGLVQMCARMGLGMVAEGVETAAQAEILGLMGIHRYQGWHFAPALAADEVDQLLSAGEALPV